MLRETLVVANQMRAHKGYYSMHIMIRHLKRTVTVHQHVRTVNLNLS